jgi:type I restriction enzyme S subunit
MSKIDRLLAEHCPEGVEVKTLGEIGTFIRGRRFTKADMVEEGIPCIHYGEIYTEYSVSTESTISHVRTDLRDQLRYAQPGDVIVASVGETVEDVGKAVAWLGTEEVAIHDDSFLFRSKLDPTYVSYYFQTRTFHTEKAQHVSRAKMKRLSSSGLSRLTIPVPPPEVQHEIARILDRMAELQAELQAQLQAELQARTRQYEHYRDQLFAFTERDDIRWVPMGAVGTFIRGRRFTKNDMVAAGMEAIHYGEIYTEYRVATSKAVSHVRESMANQLRFASPGDVVIAGVGETVEDVGKAVAWLGSDDVAIHDDTFAYRHDMNPKFVSYYLQTTAFHAQKERHVSRAKVKRLSSGGLAQIKIPVPSREEQDRIVAILDRFDTLIREMSIDLPAEIAARRNQYEYYRDRLLTFEERVA